MFNSYYDVGGQRFANIFQAFDKSIENGQFCYYKTDADWIDQIQSIKVESDINHLHLKQIYAKKLKELRQQHNKLVLLYTGGTDSHTILDTAIKNKIYIDEVFMSFPGIFEAESDKILNKEYNVALEFVKKNVPHNVGKIKFYKWTYENYDYLDSKEWWKNPEKCQFNIIKVQPCWAQYAADYYKDLDGIVISGHEKPSIRFINDKFYWFVTDGSSTEHKIIKKSFPFFLDPTIVVNYAYAVKNLLQNHLHYFSKIDDRYDFFWKLPKAEIENFYRSLALVFLNKESIDFTIKPKWGTIHNYKNQGILKQIKDSNQNDILEKIHKLHHDIYTQYSQHEHMVQTDGKFTKTVERYSQMFEFTNNTLICRGHDV